MTTMNTMETEHRNTRTPEHHNLRRHLLLMWRRNAETQVYTTTLGTSVGPQAHLGSLARKVTLAELCWAHSAKIVLGPLGHGARQHIC